MIYIVTGFPWKITNRKLKFELILYNDIPGQY